MLFRRDERRGQLLPDEQHCMCAGRNLYCNQWYGSLFSFFLSSRICLETSIIMRPILLVPVPHPTLHAVSFVPMYIAFLSFLAVVLCAGCCVYGVIRRRRAMREGLAINDNNYPGRARVCSYMFPVPFYYYLCSLEMQLQLSLSHPLIAVPVRMHSYGSSHAAELRLSGRTSRLSRAHRPAAAHPHLLQR